MAKQSFTVGQVLTAAQLTSLQQTAMLGGAASAKTASYTLVAADAGTTISMTSTSATTVTVNTGLFAAGDTVFIQNLGSGNLTITAGTATVATAGSLILPQNDAGILYFVSTSSSVFYDFIQVGAASPLTTKGDLYTFSTSDTRLGVGANGTTLVADSAEATGLKWAAAGGALTLSTIASGNLPASSTLSLTGLTGDYYMLQINAMTYATANSNMIMQFNTNTGSNYSSVSVSTTDADQAIYIGGSSFVIGSTTAISRTGTENGWIVEIKNSKNNGFHTATWMGRCQAASGSRAIMGQGYFTDATSITSIQIKISDGYSWTGGTYKLIGG
jgi:hypothetical protein